MGRASKAKGSGFERLVCRRLSLWVSHGKNEDLFWRSSLSGGRATVAQRKGRNVRQAGDICSVAPEGHVLTDDYFIECKSYRNLGIGQFLVSDKGSLVKFWKVACKEARNYGRRPMLIVKQNSLPILVIVKTGCLSRFSGLYSLRPFHFDCDVYLFDDLLGRAWQS
jgi:hypothetical protein